MFEIGNLKTAEQKAVYQFTLTRSVLLIYTIVLGFAYFALEAHGASSISRRTVGFVALLFLTAYVSWQIWGHQLVRSFFKLPRAK